MVDWTSVDDGLPCRSNRADIKYLVLLKGLYGFQTCMNIDGEWVYNRALKFTRPVTHWLKIPAYPGDGQEIK